MDNPNPIRYSDLITPDSSITDLIAQLNELIKTYDGAREKIQGAANEAAKSMRNLSGATEEQRKEIVSLTEQSEKLVKEYARITDEQRKAQRDQIAANQAKREQQQIDKLLVEINNSKEGSYKRLSAQYRLNKIRLNEMSKAERETAGVGKELERETRAIYEEMSRLQKATGKYTLEVGHYENALRGLPGPIGQVVGGFSQMRNQIVTIGNSALPIGQKGLQIFSTALLGTVGMLTMFVRYLTGAAQKLREFEQANANLSTIIGINVKDMGALTQSAMELGRTTEYTATQVVQLQTELAKLGFNQGQIINMQKSVLQFATAVGANLADAASVAGSTLRSFNLSSKDTEDALATLAVATNNSALDFNRIQVALGSVFPVADAFGISVKDATALLGGLANAGLDASSAATATRNIILKMADANGALAKSMGGPVKSFDDIINGLIRMREAGVDVANALELVGARNVSALSAFMANAESVRELRESLEDVDGELERIAEERLQTVEGSTKMLKSAWDGLILSMNESQGVIKNTIDWLTRLITKLNEAFFPTQALTTRTTQEMTAKFQTMIEEQGEKARGVIASIVDSYEIRAKEFKKKGGFWRTLFVDAQAQHDAKVALGEYQGVVNAAQIALAQMDAAAKEAQPQTQPQPTVEPKPTIDPNAAKKAEEQRKKELIAARRAVVESINNEIAITSAGTDKMLELRLDKVEAERQLELEQNRQKTKAERQDEAAINAKYDKKALETEKAFNIEVSKLAVQRLQAEQQAIQLEIAVTEEGTEEMLNLRLANIEKQREIELEQNRQKAEEMQQSESAINAKYDSLRLKERAEFNNKLAQRDMNALRDLNEAEFNLLTKNERQKTLFRLQQEKQRLLDILELNKTATKKMTDNEIAAIKATIEGIDREMGSLGYNNLYELLGLSLDEKQQSALNSALDAAKESLSSLADSWNKAAEAAVKAADEQVAAAQKVLDAEIEARNAGYANNVAMAQKELQVAEESRKKALQEQQKAQAAQITLDTLSQASSLITATANIWKAFSGAGALGIAAAIAATGLMWGSFTAAKIRAYQVSGVEQYGEGTVELLEGGSHASGHDIDLGTKPDGTKRRAEGGEYFAVINKRNSRRYRSVIPDVIKSFNDGSFADKYMRADENIINYASVDVSGISRDVKAIREQGNREQFVDGTGTTIIRYKNLTRKIKS